MAPISIDEIAINHSVVMPAKAGIHRCLKLMDSGFRRNDVNTVISCL